MALKVSTAEQARLRQLSQTAQRELEHLQITTGRLFAQPFTPEELQAHCQNVDFAERLDAFVARFGAQCR